MSTEQEIDAAPVRYDVKGSTAWSTLDRPEQLNAPTHGMYRAVGRLK